MKKKLQREKQKTEEVHGVVGKPGDYKYRVIKTTMYGDCAMSLGMSSRMMVVMNRVFAIALAAAFLAGCSGGNDDLSAYVNTVKAKPAGKISPVPEFKPYESFAYDDANLRDPFSAVTDNETVEKNSEFSLRPNMNRNKEALEEYPLDTLHFVGHLEKDEQKWAIITSPDNLVYRVKVGNHLGENYGEIVAITETQIDIKEIIQDGLGGWIEREAALSLTE